MPQILRKVNDTITVTCDASNARYPTAVILPPRGERRGEADAVLITPTTNVGRYAWDSAEGADATVAATAPIAAGATLVLPIPEPPRTADEVALQRHVIELDWGTAMADGEQLLFSDGDGHTLTLEADPSNNGVTGGTTEIGTNASTNSTQAAGVAAALLAWGSGAYVRAQVDVEDDTKVILMGHTAGKNITVTKTMSTGVVTVTDYGRNHPILYVLSATTSTAISVGTAVS